MGFQFLSGIIISILVMNYLFSKCKINDTLDTLIKSPKVYDGLKLCDNFRQKSCMKGPYCTDFEISVVKWHHFEEKIIKGNLICILTYGFGKRICRSWYRPIAHLD